MKYCVLIPSYNNAPTLEPLLREILEITPDLLVIDDGCTDQTPLILDRFPSVLRINHPSNRGKGAALRSGMKAAWEEGYTHVITMDSDGQHQPSDLLYLIQAMMQNPDSLIIGHRRLKGIGAPLKSRILRFNSNFWVWAESGNWISDTQSGFRVYPLAPVVKLHLTTDHYDFEIEVLVKALWNKIPACSVPISVLYETGSPSHFKPVLDFWRVARLTASLLTVRLHSFLKRLPGKEGTCPLCKN